MIYPQYENLNNSKTTSSDFEFDKQKCSQKIIFLINYIKKE